MNLNGFWVEQMSMGSEPSMGMRLLSPVRYLS
jgi:hypothetical protein